MAKHIKKVRGLKLLTRNHPEIKTLMTEKDAPEIHGDKVWFSSYMIMDFLDDNPPDEGSRVLEIGCGWGILSLYCAKAFKAKVVASDADRFVFPFLRLHARENDVKVKTRISKYEKLDDKLLARQDYIVGGDICFWDELVEPLYNTIRRGLHNGVRTIIIADPGRSPFLRLAERCKQDFRAFLISYAITDPSAHDGYLLVVTSQ